MAQTYPPRIKTSYVTTDDTEAVVYTCPLNSIAKVVSLGLVQHSGTGIGAASMVVYDSSDTELYHVATDANMPYILDEFVIVLNAGDYITVSSESASFEVDGVVTVEEIFSPVG